MRWCSFVFRGLAGLGDPAAADALHWMRRRPLTVQDSDYLPDVDRVSTACTASLNVRSSTRFPYGLTWSPSK